MFSYNFLKKGLFLSNSGIGILSFFMKCITIIITDIYIKQYIIDIKSIVGGVHELNTVTKMIYIMNSILKIHFIQYNITIIQLI